jgi:hypothetical protein
LSVRYFCRKAARPRRIPLHCDPLGHATMRNSTHRAAADCERWSATQPTSDPNIDEASEILVPIDGAHIRAAHGYQLRHLGVTVGRIEVKGKPPLRFAFASKGAESPLARLRQPVGESRGGRWVSPSLHSPTARQRRLGSFALRRQALHLHFRLVECFHASVAPRASIAGRIRTRSATPSGARDI